MSIVDEVLYTFFAFPQTDFVICFSLGLVSL